MRFAALSTLALGSTLVAACAPDAPTLPDLLAPEDALLSRNSKTDQDANFKYDKNNDDWYCVKSEPGPGPMYTDNDTGTDTDQDGVEDCPQGYTLQKEL